MRFPLLPVIVALGLSPALAQDEPEPVRRAAGVPPRAASVGPLQVDVAAEYFVVTDPIRRQVAVYRVEGRSLEFLGTRGLDADLAVEPQRRKEDPAIPSTDSPGDDPPGFVRPKGSVRIQAQYKKRSDTSEEWWASYFVGSSVEAVFEDLRKAHRDMSVTTWEIDTHGTPKRGRLELAGSGTQLQIDILAGALMAPEFHVRVNVAARITK